jgi:O-antigen/teichoic acid export membrane protein
MQEIFKTSLSRLVFLGLNFLTGLLIASLSGAGAFGDLSLMIVNASVIHLITGFGADQSIVWHGAGKDAPHGKIFSFLGITAILQLAFFLILSFLYYRATSSTVLSGQASFNWFYYELIYFTGLIILEKYLSVLYALHLANSGNKLLAFVTAIPFIYLLLVRLDIIKTTPDPLLFYCTLIPLQAFSLVVYVHISFSIKLVLFSKSDLRSFLQFSFIVFITNLVQFLAYRADYWFIDFFAGTEQVGIYSQANRFAQLLWILPNVLAALLIPSIVSGKIKNEGEVATMVRVVNAINIFIIAAIAIIAVIIYNFFLGGEFYTGFIPLLIMLPGFYFFSITLVLAAYFSAKRFLWVNFTGSLICLFIIAIADILLIPVWGITGAAWANLAAYTAASVFNIFMFKIKTGMRLIDLMMIQKKDKSNVKEFLNAK